MELSEQQLKARQKAREIDIDQQPSDWNHFEDFQKRRQWKIVLQDIESDKYGTTTAKVVHIKGFTAPGNLPPVDEAGILDYNAFCASVAKHTGLADYKLAAKTIEKSCFGNFVAYYQPGIQIKHNKLLGLVYLFCFVLDDIIDEGYDSLLSLSNPKQITEIIRIFENVLYCKNGIKTPDSINGKTDIKIPDSSPIIQPLCKTLIEIQKEALRLENDWVDKGVLVDSSRVLTVIMKAFKDIAWHTGMGLTRSKSEVAFQKYRQQSVAWVINYECIQLVKGITLDQEITSHPVYQTLIDLASWDQALINDLLSLQNDLTDNDSQGNAVLSKMVTNPRLTLCESIDNTVVELNRLRHDIVSVANSLLKIFPEKKHNVQESIKTMLFSMDGHIMCYGSKNAPKKRYGIIKVDSVNYS